MIDRLQRALQRVNDLPTDVQEQLAEQIEDLLPIQEGAREYFGGSMPDIPEDAEETLLRMRHAVPPSKPIDLGDDV